jgi:hypothetical protein
MSLTLLDGHSSMLFTMIMPNMLNSERGELKIRSAVMLFDEEN